MKQYSVYSLLVVEEVHDEVYEALMRERHWIPAFAGMTDLEH